MAPQRFVEGANAWEKVYKKLDELKEVYPNYKDYFEQIKTKMQSMEKKGEGDPAEELDIINNAFNPHWIQNIIKKYNEGLFNEIEDALHWMDAEKFRQEFGDILPKNAQQAAFMVTIGYTPRDLADKKGGTIRWYWVIVKTNDGKYIVYDLEDAPIVKSPLAYPIKGKGKSIEEAVDNYIKNLRNPLQGMSKPMLFYWIYKKISGNHPITDYLLVTRTPEDKYLIKPF